MQQRFERELEKDPMFFNRFFWNWRSSWDMKLPINCSVWLEKCCCTKQDSWFFQSHWGKVWMVFGKQCKNRIDDEPLWIFYGRNRERTIILTTEASYFHAAKKVDGARKKWFLSQFVLMQLLQMCNLGCGLN